MTQAELYEQCLAVVGFGEDATRDEWQAAMDAQALLIDSTAPGCPKQTTMYVINIFPDGSSTFGRNATDDNDLMTWWLNALPIPTATTAPPSPPAPSGTLVPITFNSINAGSVLVRYINSSPIVGQVTIDITALVNAQLTAGKNTGMWIDPNGAAAVSRKPRLSIDGVDCANLADIVRSVASAYPVNSDPIALDSSIVAWLLQYDISHVVGPAKLAILTVNIAGLYSGAGFGLDFYLAA